MEAGTVVIAPTVVSAVRIVVQTSFGIVLTRISAMMEPTTVLRDPTV